MKLNVTYYKIVIIYKMRELFVNMGFCIKTHSVFVDISGMLRVIKKSVKPVFIYFGMP